MQEGRGGKRLLSRAAFFFVIVAISALADQYSKDVMWAFFEREGIVEVRFTQWFSLLQRTNTGAAWSTLAEHPEILTVATSLITLALTVYALRTFMTRAALWPWAIIAGGALGNIIDRIRGMGPMGEPAVRDFLDFHWGPHHFPTFNLADSLICIGVGWLLIFPHKTEKQS